MLEGTCFDDGQGGDTNIYLDSVIGRRRVNDYINNDKNTRLIMRLFTMIKMLLTGTLSQREGGDNNNVDKYDDVDKDDNIDKDNNCAELVVNHGK